MLQSNRLGLLAAAAFMALVSGCYADAGAEPEYPEYVEASAAPVDLAVAPRCDYEGRTVYYSNDHWYAQDRGRWVYYRNEPQALYDRRVEVQETARARVVQAREEATTARRDQ